MALKRLDEEFELKPGTQLLPYMKRLLPSLEGRFQEIESDQDVVNRLAEEIRAAALLRMNEILIPATEDIIAVTKLGFMLGPVSTPETLALGYMTMVVDEGPQRDSFTPSPYLIIEHTPDDYGIARLIGYHQADGLCEFTVTAIHGNPGPHSDWMISSTPGMADSTKLYHDAVAPMHDTVVADTAQVITLHAEIIAAAQALEESGLDAYAFIRKDGTVPFEALQRGIAPTAGANDSYIPTTAWVCARLIEYAGDALLKAGGTMTGPLYLSGAPTVALQAVTKAYVDGLISTPHVVNDYLGIRGVAPMLYLQSTGTQQNRFIESRSAAGAARWQMHMADNALESGGDVGSNWTLTRFNDGGSALGSALTVMRQTGEVRVAQAMTVGAGANITGNVTVAGDLKAYRPNTNTGAVVLNASGNAYHLYDGATHQLGGGGISVGGNSLTSGHINCYSIYTQGHPITTWGLTSHGAATINGQTYINGGLRLYGQGSNYLEFYDSDWGPMFIHHNGDLIGYLNNGGGWIQYTTNAGHLWIAQYGWLHDYVNGRASAYAWEAANYRYNQLVNSVRFVHAGDIDFGAYWYQIAEIGNACITGLQMATPFYGGPGVFWARWRQCQHNVAGGWYTSGWAS
jgi:hypothetical protein